MAGSSHWQEWHRSYDDPDSPLRRRLEVVEASLHASLDEAPPGPLRLLSLCSGDARDVLDVLGVHPRAADVTAWLVELDPVLLGRARERGERQGLVVRAVGGDAGLPANYAEAVPADVLVCCGIFGNVRDEDVRRTVLALPALARPSASVVWTRHRRPPDLTEAIRSWFTEAGFVEERFVPIEGTLAAVGRHRWFGHEGEGTGVVPERLFAFVGDGADANR